MQVIPVQPIPNQTLQVILAGQAATVSLQQTAYGLFASIYVGNSLVVASVVCQDLNRIIRDPYLGFDGDLAFYDTSGQGNDPVYTGLGSTYQLLYLEAADLPVGAG